ncbi:CLIP domain-containing serine protease B4-like isoform X2 [Panulirus ornatus]|uniref:CLIP domain-containing serine protease B4-like isoform X2 n=1 Tax=Panulirus ornatus TaxID=150431 RepID=UPI003A86762D
MSGARGVVWAGIVLATVFCCLGSHASSGGGCEDHVMMCERWAATGWCRSRPRYMHKRCRVSCNLCGVPDCFDKTPSCASWVLERSCQTQEVRDSCPHSCNACGPPTRRKTIINPEFECGGRRPPSGSRDFVHGTDSGRPQVTPERTNRVSRPTMPGAVSTVKPHSPRTVEVPAVEVSVQDTFCGATPIADRFLLTAAHCVFDPDRPVRTVRLGELDFAKENEENSRPVDYEIEKIIVHPKFDPNSTVRYNDLAILQTVEVIEFNEVVFPYCLTDQRPPPKTIVTGAGFGFVNATHQSSRLQEAELELVDTTECEDIYRRESHEPHLRVRYPDLLQNSDVMCAAYPERDACEGDSGGPLFIDKDGRRFLVGVVGSGVSCRGNSVSILPGLYISVADNIDFIDSVVYGTTRN